MDFMNCKASTMSSLSQLQHLWIVIPIDENVCSLKTDDAMIGRYSQVRNAQTGYRFEFHCNCSKISIGRGFVLGTYTLPLNNTHHSELVPRIKVAVEVTVPWGMQAAWWIPNV